MLYIETADKKLLTDDVMLKNWRSLRLPAGNYYASLTCKYAYFYTTQCVTKNPDELIVYTV